MRSRQVWRYNTAWLASQAVVEFMRFEQRVSAFGIQGSGVGQDEVQLRLDILLIGEAVEGGGF